MVGYSGTAGDSVWVHDNEFDHNMGGASMDSAFPGHPGLPQNHARFERNLIHDNNQNYYPYVADGTCAEPPVERGYEQGVVCPQISMPPGTGIITAGGNWNLYEDNWVYGHQRAAFYLNAVPAFIRGESAWGKQTDTSHHNRYAGNHLGVDRAGASRPNRTDVWWDGQGGGNCWQADAGATTPVPRPSAAPGAETSPAPPTASSANPSNSPNSSSAPTTTCGPAASRPAATGTAPGASSASRPNSPSAAPSSSPSPAAPCGGDGCAATGSRAPPPSSASRASPWTSPARPSPSPRPPSRPSPCCSPAPGGPSSASPCAPPAPPSP